jgi:hypothetical protein
MWHLWLADEQGLQSFYSVARKSRFIVRPSSACPTAGFLFTPVLSMPTVKGLYKTDTRPRLIAV